VKRWFILIAAALVVSRALAVEDALNRSNKITLSSFELKDQHQQTHRFAFPRTNLLILTVADQKGSEQVASWVRPLKERFPDGLPIEGVADLSIVPVFMRPLVRREFKNKFEHPVMLDWSGRVVKLLNCAPEVVNIFAVATNGAVLWTFRGPVETNNLAELLRLIDAHRIEPASPGFNEARTGGRWRSTPEQPRPGEGTR